MLRRPWPAPSARRPRRRALPHPGRSGGNKLCLPPGSGSKSSTSTREGSDSRPPKTRKFQAGAKIVAGLRSRVPSSPTLQSQHSVYPHTSPPMWVELWRHRTAEAKASVTLPPSEPRGKRDPSPSSCWNTWTEWPFLLARASETDGPGTELEVS